MNSSPRLATIFGTMMLALVTVTMAGTAADVRAATGGWSFWNIFGAATSSSAAACSTGLRCNPAATDPASICGEGKTPVFADPVNLKSYGECLDNGSTGQCFTCVLVFVSKKSSVSSFMRNDTPPAEGYVCRGISGNDAGVPADCGTLGMKGTRCPDGSAVQWHGQIDAAKSDCALSARCNGRWGKCSAASSSSFLSSTMPSSSSSSRSLSSHRSASSFSSISDGACVAGFTCDLQCQGTQCTRIAIDCFIADIETSGTCGIGNQGRCTRCASSKHLSSSSTISASSISASSKNPCPTPKCALPARGCSYMASNERDANNCPLYPCGKLVCSAAKSSSSIAKATVCIGSFSYDVSWKPVVGRFNCPLTEHCSTEDGACDPSPGCSGDACAAVCAGTCKPGPSKFLE